MTNVEKKNLCRGCRNDFYNLPGNSTSGECWSLKSAKVVERVAVGTWQTPPYVWTPKRVLDCRHGNGQHFLLREDVRVVKNEKEAEAWRARHAPATR